MSLLKEEIALSIERLLAYGIQTGLLKEEDRTFTRNQIIEALQIEDFRPLDLEDLSDLDLLTEFVNIDAILKPLLDYSAENGLLKVDSLGGRDLQDAKLMGLLMEKPNVIHKAFASFYEESPEKATDYYYNLSLASNYIRKARTDQNRVWQVESPYGKLDITINLSKPEKDPKEIEAERHAVKAAYPKCLLCVENEGYMGRMNHPARQNHRIIPVTLAGEPWFFQYSPYAYYNEHAIVLSASHRPMVIERNSFVRLLDFVKWLPHYFVGSNADLPIVGGSILSHDHFQGGNYEFPMDRAKVLKIYEKNGARAEILHWPLSVVRIKGKSPEALVDLAEEILAAWIGYTNEGLNIVSHTEGVRHNTITPVARVREGIFELSLVLRNNRTSTEYPDGIFHPHREIHPIKRENIGLIEVMGLAVLPARLHAEMGLMAKSLMGEPLSKMEEQLIEIHQPMLEALSQRQGGVSWSEDSINQALMSTVGQYFGRGLEHSGVFKMNDEGLTGFDGFLRSLGWILGE